MFGMQQVLVKAFQGKQSNKVFLDGDKHLLCENLNNEV